MSVASSSFQPCVLNKRSDSHTHTHKQNQTQKLSPEDWTRLPIANCVLQTLAKQKPEHKHRRPISSFNCQSFPSNTGTKQYNNTHRKTRRYKPEDQFRLPTASHGPCIRTPLFPKPGVDNDFIFSINWLRILNQIQWSWPGHRNATLQNLVIWLTINNCHAG